MPPLSATKILPRRLTLAVYCVCTFWSCVPALARTGKIYLKVNRPEIRQLSWLGERVAGQAPVWQAAPWTSAGFEIDLGSVDTLHIEVVAQAPMSGLRGLLLDWTVRQRIAVTSGLLPAVYAEAHYNWARLLAILALPTGLLWWRRRVRRVAGYQLGPLLGRGGSGEVYLARRGSSQVALKRLRASHAEELQRLEREIATCRALEHPHIVPLLGSGPDYLVMEWMSGGSLRSRLGQPYDALRAAELLGPLFAAVEYAHGQGVIHRDLKPENILFDQRGCLKIADFGLARHTDSQTITQEGLVQGSPAYMAPEQIQGATREPGIDQYALGILSYQVFSGRLPFEPPWLEKHLHQPVPGLSEWVGPRVDAVLQRMLEKRAELRYPTVGEAWRALSEALLQLQPGSDGDETGVSSSS